MQHHNKPGDTKMTTIKAANLRNLPLIKAAYEGQTIESQVFDAAYLWATGKGYSREMAQAIAKKTSAKYAR